MVNIIKQELEIEESLRKKLELICGFAKTTPTIINGNIRKIDRTNLTYIEPNRIIINEIKKLYQNDFGTSSYYSNTNYSNTKFNIFIWRSRDDTL